MKVVIALSGGVDSSVAAALLVNEGYEVVGVTMRLWSEPGCEEENQCCTPQTRFIASRLADRLGIPFHVLETSEVFRRQVVQPFIEGYSRGHTPSPCIYCNKMLKWAYLWDYCQSIGANYLATGHYARILRDPQGKLELLRGLDESKDQSYFLSMLTQKDLSHTLFPLANYTKQAVREYAQTLDLPSADQPESQDLCFLGARDYRVFLAKYAPQVVNPGKIVDSQGKELGDHNGLAFYTIGQRKGLPSSDQALYVLEKDIPGNRLVVGLKSELGKQQMSVTNVNWISGEPLAEEFLAEVKIRYKAVKAAAVIRVLGYETVHVDFLNPIRDITAGQLAVFYQGEKVLGGGFIR